MISGVTSNEELPLGFAADVRQAALSGRTGLLGLLSLEAEFYAWRLPALRLVAAELVRLGAWRSAIRPLEHLLKLHPEDPVALLSLAKGGAALESESPRRALVFTGHMIDEPGRKNPRFPPAAETTVRQAILLRMEQLLASSNVPLIGLAGGASGGDILFHEVCAQLGIETLLRLTLPEEHYIQASVAPAGEDWVRRFHAIREQLGPSRIQVLGDSTCLPDWMGERPDYDVWQRTNLWLAQEAIALASERALLAVWNGRTGDGPGGTQHLMDVVPGFGMTVLPPIRPTP